MLSILGPPVVIKRQTSSAAKRRNAMLSELAWSQLTDASSSRPDQAMAYYRGATNTLDQIPPTPTNIAVARARSTEMICSPALCRPPVTHGLREWQI
jgi:hypothetical protein